MTSIPHTLSRGDGAAYIHAARFHRIFRSLTITACFLFVTCRLNAQTYPIILQQASPAEGTMNSVEIAPDNGIIAAGNVTDSITLGSNTLHHTGAYLTRYDSTGQNQWLIPAGDFTTQYGYMEKKPNVAVDASNNVYVMGIFGNTASIGTFTLTDTGSGNVFLAKLTAAGNVIWAKKIAGNSVDLRDMTVDFFGNIYITGMMLGTFINGGDTLSPEGYDVITLSLDNGGNYRWMRKGGGTSNQYSEGGYGIATDADGSVYVTGHVRSTDASFDGLTLPITSTAGFTGFLARYDSSGNILWVKKCGYESFAVATDPLGHVFAAGYTYSPFIYDTVQLNPGGGISKSFVVRVTSDGNFSWASFTHSETCNAYDVDADEHGNSYFCGITRDTTYVTGPVDTLVLINDLYPLPTNDGMVVSLDSTGNPVWGNLVKSSGLSFRMKELSVRNCRLAFSGYFSTPQPVYYNADSIATQGANDGFIIVENSCNLALNSPEYFRGSDKLVIYPNPFSSEVKISVNNLMPAEAALYDFSGKLLMHKLFNGTLTVDMADCVSGVYLVRVQSEGRWQSAKVVKQ
jgi:hypothetical protein